MLRRSALFSFVLVSCGWFAPQPPAPPVASTPEEPPHVAPAPTDVEPAERGSPAGSLAACPAWGRSRGYAPAIDIDDAEYLFEAGAVETETRASLDGELLACRVDVKFEEIKSWSLRPHKWKNADLAIAYGFGEGGALREGALFTSGRNQTNHTHLVLPAARMNNGDVIDVLLNDVDRLFARDYIDRVTLGFSGSTPLVATTGTTSIVCRLVAPANLRPFVHARLWDVDDALATWQRDEPDIRSGTAICAPPKAVKETIVAVAGLLGWNDPRTVSRIERAAATELAVMQACADRFARFVAGLDSRGAPATLAGTDIGVRVVESSCEPEQCKVALEVTNRSSTAFVIPGGDRIHEQWEIVALDARGRSLVTMAPDPKLASRTVAAGAVVRHELVTGRHRSTLELGTAADADSAPAPAAMIELRERVDSGRAIPLRL